MLSIWHLLTCMCAFMSIGGAVISIMQVKVGFAGDALGLCGGLVVGVFCAATMWKVTGYAAANSQRRPEGVRNWPIIFVSVGLIPWMLLAGLFGRWVSLALLRFIV